MEDEEFAFPRERKEPLVDARHVRNAVARFDQVENVSDRERDEAWRRIKRAAKRFDVDIAVDDWRSSSAGKRPPSTDPATPVGARRVQDRTPGHPSQSGFLDASGEADRRRGLLGLRRGAAR